MKLRNIVILFFTISILFVYPAESKILEKDQAVYSGRLSTITPSKNYYKLSVGNKIFFISRENNKLFNKAETLVRKDVRIIYDKKNYFITFIELLQQQLKI